MATGIILRTWDFPKPPFFVVVEIDAIFIVSEVLEEYVQNTHDVYRFETWETVHFPDLKIIWELIIFHRCFITFSMNSLKTKFWSEYSPWRWITLSVTSSMGERCVCCMSCACCSWNVMNVREQFFCLGFPELWFSAALCFSPGYSGATCGSKVKLWQNFCRFCKATLFWSSDAQRHVAEGRNKKQLEAFLSVS